MELHCPDGTAHLYQIVINDHCVETIKRLTADPSANDADVRVRASEYPMRDGSTMTVAPSAGELLTVQCAKCGREAIVSIGWRD